MNRKYIQNLADQYDAIKVSADNICADLSEDQFNRRPHDKRWSVGECIDHLIASYNAYNPIIKNAISNNLDESINDENFKSRLRFKLFTAWLEPPYKMKMKTFKIFLPQKKLNKDETITKFLIGTDECIELIRKSEKVDLKRTIIVSPVSDSLKFQLGELYPFMAAHIRRHLWQAEQVKNVIL